MAHSTTHGGVATEPRPPVNLTGRNSETAEVQTAAVVAAITTMRDQLGEPQELRDFARTALMSPFHFHRVFRRLTATTPGRFLTALRIARARRLLLETAMSSTDISIAVGYSSFGTFTTQFTRLVGLSPGRFRATASRIADLAVGEVLRCDRRAVGLYRRGARGWIGDRPDARPGVAVTGLFPSRIPQSVPVACGLGRPPGPVRLPETDAEGAYEALVISVAEDATVGQVLTDDPASGRYVGTADEPVELGAARAPDPFWIQLREPRITDPPLLIAFPLLFATPEVWNVTS